MTLDDSRLVESEAAASAESGGSEETRATNDAHPVDSEAVTSEPKNEDPFATSFAVLRAILDDRIPSRPLDSASVPQSLLEIPIALATYNAIEHIKHCKKPHCEVLPDPLLKYKRMRPGALAKSPNDVHKTLWTHSGHRFVTRVRRSILDNEQALAEQVRSGEVFTGPVLEKLLVKNKDQGLARLAAVLWALEFKPNGSENLFRLLMLVGEGGAKGVATAISQRGATKDSKREIRRLEKRVEDLERTIEDLENRLKAKERSFERVRPEQEEAKRTIEQYREQLQIHEEQATEVGEALRKLETDLARLTRINGQLRNDLRCAQTESRNLEQERGELAGRLASQRRLTENVERKLEILPTGAEAVWDFLTQEEASIQQARLIQSGGAKARADERWKVHGKLERAFLDAYPDFREPPPVRIRPKSSLRLVTLGGSNEVGRSSYLLQLGSRRILVDCGLKPRPSEDLLPAIDRLDTVDALVLTHAHTDHVGWVAALVRRFPDLQIYCSEGTAALLPAVLEDCHQHYLRKLVRRREIASYSRSSPEIQEAYNEDDVRRVSELAITCALDTSHQLPFGDISLTFFQAGHILGASSVLVADTSGRRVFFSGDFSSFPQLTIPAARWPEGVTDVDMLVMESTYGARPHHDPLEESREKLVQFIGETTAAGGSVILACFALGRAQELLKLIATAQDADDLPDLPVHVDGMIRRVNPTYKRMADFKLEIDAFIEVSGETERQELIWAAQERPAIIVTTSGMLAGGPVVEYARHLLPDPRHRIVLTGYQDETAPSRALLDITATGRGARQVVLHDEGGEPIEFNVAHPAKEFKLSSHADQAGLVDYSRRIRARQVALVHGELDSQKKLAHQLSKVHPGSEVVCGPDELISP